MTIGFSIFLIAVGAILRYAVNVNSDTIDVPTVGLILMIAGGAGLALSLLYELLHTRPAEGGYEDRGSERRDDRYTGPDDPTRPLR